VDLSALQDAIADADDGSVVSEQIVLPSKSNKTVKRGQLDVTVYHYRVEPGPPLAICFEVGKKYSIGLANRDLGTHRWIDGSNHTPPSDTVTATQTLTAESTADSETCDIASSPHGGFAVLHRSGEVDVATSDRDANASPATRPIKIQLRKPRPRPTHPTRHSNKPHSHPHLHPNTRPPTLPKPLGSFPTRILRRPQPRPAAYHPRPLLISRDRKSPDHQSQNRSCSSRLSETRRMRSRGRQI
jgi:hypothetical protein